MKARKKPGLRKGDNRAEMEYRLANVQRWLAAGITSDSELVFKLSELGIEVSEFTVCRYKKKIMKRLREENEEVRAIRKNLFIREIQELDRELLEKLLASEQEPTWKDYIKLKEVRLKAESGAYTSDMKSVLIQGVDRAQELNEMSLDQLQARLGSLLKKSRENKTVH